MLALVSAWSLLPGAIGRFLVVEDPLRPASAIIVMGGSTPYREMEAAALYGAGWAPRLYMVRAGRSNEATRLMAELGVPLPDQIELRRQVLERLGVRSEDIVVAPGNADASLDELELIRRTLPADDRPVILVSSPYHTRRVGTYWGYLDGRPGIVRPARRDRFDTEGWHRDQGQILSVVRELLGLANYAIGFPIAQRQR